MSNFSSTYPSQRPVFALDAANAGRLDPRMTFSRSDTPPTYAAPSAVHYWSNEKHLSSENLITNSEDFSAWTASNTTPTANAVAAPDGTTTADTITGTGTGSIQKSVQNDIPATDYPVVSVYVKAGTHNLVQIQSNWSGSHYANFDVTSGAGAVGSLGANTTATIQAVGSTGWYRCICRFNAASMSPTIFIRLVDSTSAGYGATTTSTGTVHLWGAMATGIGDLTNIVAYQPSTTSIHRQYAPSLKSVATAGQPRFEYSADGQSVAKGILIESQATNLNPYSDALASWGTNNALTLSANAGVGPDGSLGADLIVANTANDTHYIRSAVITVSASSAYTFSGYFKSLNGEKLRLVFFQSAAPFTGEAGAVFTLTGSGSAAASAGSASITSVGNGYYRCTVTGTTLTTGSYLQVQTVSTSDSQVYVGNAYNGVLCAGIQFESGSHASSLISTSGSAVTRAAESLSMIDESIFEGGEHSVYWEGTVNGSTSDPRLMELSDGTSANRIQLFHNDGNKVMLRTTDSGATQGAMQISELMTGNSKVVATLKTSEARLVRNGSTITSSTSDSFYSPSGLRKINIGTNYAQGSQLDGHVKRVAYYNTALTQTQAEALSS